MKIVVNLLKNTDFPFPVNIVNTLPIRVPQERLPIIFVSAPADHATAKAVGPANYRRNVYIVLQIFLNFDDPVKGQQDINDLCSIVEDAIQCDRYFQGSIEGIMSFKFDLVFHADTAIPIAEARYEFECQYTEVFYPDGTDLLHIDATTEI